MSASNTDEPRRGVFKLLIGPPLETSAVPHQVIGKIPALAVFSSDALSSVAYATQEMLAVLALAGSGYFGISIPLSLAIAGLLVILTVSYRQTIFAYPNGGGAYIVARDNLGEVVAQVAGAALMTDYILTVAVSISSGVAQITSAAPGLYSYRVSIAIAMILVITMINLRGIRESSVAFAFPTYLFIGMILLMLAVGFWRLAGGSLSTVRGVPRVGLYLQPVTIFLVLRAFSSGCTALTGVEAISNGVTAFKEPRSKNAANTMLAMSLILMTMFIGITVLAHQVSAVPSDTVTVIAQIALTVFGNGGLYLLTITATTVVLIMAANTSFADFPRLAALQASDRYLPRQLSYRGSRLVFSWGIVLLAGIACLLVIVFQASVTALIPLYAIGVFLSFTISQAGMVRHWRKVSKLTAGEEVKTHDNLMGYDPHWRIRLVVNLVGAIATAVVTLIFTVTKFSEGAWVTVLLIPLMVWSFFAIHRSYRKVAERLSMENVLLTPMHYRVRTLVLVDNVHAGTVQLVDFANSLGRPWQAIHVAIDPELSLAVQQKWKERIGIGELKILPSPYRSLTGPIRRYISSLQQEDPDAIIQLIVGQLALPNYWEQALHRNTNIMIDLILRDMDRVVVTSVPYQINASEKIGKRLQIEQKADQPSERKDALS